ncbi:MAG: hypothetical protein KC912_05175 [Proteobacteria bacterium]|nr:hypothetical protein [Pseudomonadota bacterium]
MDKREVLRVLGRFGLANELLGRPQARAWSRAVWVLRGVDGDFSELFHSGELAEIKGVGKGTLAVIAEVLAGVTPTPLLELESELPEGLFQIAKIRGLGPKKVKTLWDELGVTTLGELEYACTENRLVQLSGFGQKTQAKVLVEIARLGTYEGWFRRDRAQQAAALALQGCVDGEVAGELACGAELVRGVVVVAQATAGDNWELREDGFHALMEGVPVRVRLAPAASRGTALVLETSDEAHLEALQQRSAEPLAALARATEKGFYEALGLSTTPRERRRGGVELVQQGVVMPQLLEFGDLRGALHNHTVASDGAGTVADMRLAATDLGLDWLGISEHSASAGYAGGLQAAALRQQLAELRKLDGHGAHIFAGVESDIRREGELDYTSDLLRELDFVVASVHQRYRQTPEEMTERVLKALRTGLADVVGHPTGRLLLGRPDNGLDVRALIEGCAEWGSAVELNASPHRLDLGAEPLEWAREAGVMVSIAADAHSPRALANLHHGVAVARRAGLRAEHVLNAMSVDELGGWVARRRAQYQ